MNRVRQAVSICWIVVVPLIALTASIAQGASDQERKQLDSAYATARATGDAMLNGDFQKIVDLTHPKVVELLGGREKELAEMRELISQAKAQGFSFTAVNFDKPTKLFQANGRLFTIVPEAVVLRTPDGKSMTQPSYLLAISEDDAKSWKLIDGGTVPPQKLRELMPDLPADLKLPNDVKPAPPTTLTSPDGRIQLRLPDGWVKAGGEPSPTEMWARDQATGATCMVTWADKSNGVNLAKYAQSLKDEAQAAIKDLHSTDPKDERIGGHPAIRYDLTGVAGRVRCGLVLTVMETDTRFAGIFVKSELAQFDEHKAGFAKLAEGLTETAATP